MLFCLIGRVKHYLENLSASRQYNVLHLRAETDWMQQCERWGRANSGEEQPDRPCTAFTLQVGYCSCCMLLSARVCLCFARNEKIPFNLQGTDWTIA